MSVFNQSRSNVIRLIFLLMFLIIVVRLFTLQVLTSKYQKMAQDNALYVKTVYPDRGIVFDRKGRAILNNARAFDLMVTPNQIKNPDTIALCKALGIDTAEFKKRVVNAIFKNGRYRPSVFQSLLSQEQYAKINENIWKFTGFDLLQRPIRTYPYGVGAHLFGYVGEVDSSDIKRSNYFYRMGDFVGKSGLERTYESVLMGQRGVEVLIKDNRNRIQGSYENKKYDTLPIAGRNLKTYIDIDLQLMAEKMIANKLGAVVAIEPKTGGILAMASGPTFDPNSISGSEGLRNLNRMLLDVSGPVVNRAIKGLYPPGSTFKPLQALVALDEGVITPSFGYPCSGRYYGCGHGKPGCTHSNAGHAANLRLAIANSCNSYFSHIYRMTVDYPKFGSTKNGYHIWSEYMNKLGLGNRLGIDLPSEDKGLIPDTARYNRVYRGSWNSCTNLTLGIGQDMMLTTPLQLANAMCIIANKGYYYTPHVVQSIEGETASDTLLQRYRVKNTPLENVPAEVYEAVMDGMQDVVIRGTAVSAAIPGINVCAKTGTAQNKRYIDGRVVELKDNAVFVCFAPREDPKIAIAVVVENAGYGGTWGGPIASIMMEKYLNDTLRPERIKKMEEVANANLMPWYIKRLQFIQDSTSAYKWLEAYKDSSQLKRFFDKYKPTPKPDSAARNDPSNRNPQNRLQNNITSIPSWQNSGYPFLFDQIVAAQEWRWTDEDKGNFPSFPRTNIPWVYKEAVMPDNKKWGWSFPRYENLASQRGKEANPWNRKLYSSNSLKKPSA